MIRLSHLHIVSFLQLQKLKLNTWVFCYMEASFMLFFVWLCFNVFFVSCFFSAQRMYSKQAAMLMILRNVFQEGPRTEKKCRQQPYNGWQWMSLCLRGTSWRAERWVARSVGFILFAFHLVPGYFRLVGCYFCLGGGFCVVCFKVARAFCFITAFDSSTVRWPTIELVRLPRKKKCFCFCVVVFWCVCVSMFFRVCVFAFVFLQVVFLFACLCVFVLFVAKNCLV